MKIIFDFIVNNYFGIILCLLIGYLSGSINASIIITKKAVNKDIRTLGSGNAGFTNVLRCVGVKQAIYTIAIDFLKAVIAVEIAGIVFPLVGSGNHLENYGRIIAGAACVIGHMYPLYFGFRGGKGVVTSAAMMCILDWRIFLLSVGVFLITFLLSRIVSLSSICGAIAYPIITFFMVYFVDYLGSLNTDNPLSIMYVTAYVISSLFLAFLVIIRHKSNIKKLLRGEEKKISVKR